MLQGAGVALAIAVPAALLGQGLTAADVIDADSAWLAPFVLVVLVGFGIGGGMAARSSEATPLRDGALASLLAFAVLQVIAVARILVAGDDVFWLQLVFNALLAASAGVVGAMVALRRAEVAAER